MTSLRFSVDEALKNASGNSARAWSVGTGSAMARYLEGGYFTVTHKPKFALSKDDPIFTVGSCFAREIENVLLILKVPLTSANHGVPAEAFATWNEETGTGGGAARGQLSRGAFNKYAVQPMSHDIERVLTNAVYANEGLIEIGTDKWFDPHSSGLKLLPLDQALANRKRIANGIATIRQAKTVFLTLGLTESWLDTETGMAMNAHPGALALKKFGKRFEFVDYGFDEIVSEMEKLISLIRKHANSEMRFLITVSPVPLGSTFRITDVVISNAGSKSVLRTAADAISRRHEYVDYFPSYEMVINSPRSLAWHDDQLHVTTNMVRHVMSVFKSSYFPEIQA